MKFTNEELLKKVDESGWLNLSYQFPKLNDDDMVQLAKFLKEHPEIQKVNVAGNILIDEGVEILAAVDTLTALNVSDNGISYLGVKALVKSRLEELDLNNNAIGDEGVELFKGNHALKVLDISGNLLTGECTKFLVDTHLEKLNIGDNDIGDEGVKPFSGHRTLTDLNLTQSEIGDEGVKILASIKLKRLCLLMNHVSSFGVKSLATGCTQTTLTNLSLSHNKLDDGSVEALMAIKTLTRLDVSHNKISKAGIAVLLKNKNPLLTVDVNHNSEYNSSSDEKVETINSTSLAQQANPSFFTPPKTNVVSTTSLLESELKGELFEVFDGAFIGLLECLDELEERSKRLLVDILLSKHEPELNAQIVIQYASTIDSSIGSSLDVLFCGLYPAKWNETDSKHKKSILNDIAISSLKPGSPQSEINARIEYLKKRAYALVSQGIDGIKKKINFQANPLTEAESQRKEKILKQIALEEKTEQATLPEGDFSLNQDFIEVYTSNLKDEDFNVLDTLASKARLTQSKETPKVSIVDKGKDKTLQDGLKELTLYSEAWEKIYKLVRYTPTHKRLRDNIKMFGIVKAILHKEISSCSWRELPQKFPPWASVYYHYRLWSRLNVLDQIKSIIADQSNQDSVALTAQRRV